MDKETYADVFAACDWDLWTEQFIIDRDVDPVESEREATDRQ